MFPVTRPIRLLPCLASALVLFVAGTWSETCSLADDGGTVIAPAPEVVGDEPSFAREAPVFESVPRRGLPESFGLPPVAPPIAPPPITTPPVAVPARAARVEWSVAPPPGTLGRTYRQPSALIPKDEHPRTAMIDVASAALPFVEVIGLEDFEGFRGRDGLWHFKSKKPLLPGVPHIYQVVAHDGTPGGREDVRTVRMIPGRIVRLAF